GDPGSVEDRVPLDEVVIAVDPGAVAVLEVTKALFDVAGRHLGQGDEIPRPRQRHARAGLAGDLFGTQRVGQASVTALVECGQARVADVGHRQRLARPGRLELLLRTQEVL